MYYCRKKKAWYGVRVYLGLHKFTRWAWGVSAWKQTARGSYIMIPGRFSYTWSVQYVKKFSQGKFDVRTICKVQYYLLGRLALWLSGLLIEIDWRRSLKHSFGFSVDDGSLYGGAWIYLFWRFFIFLAPFINV
jgi:hypothetical protein